MQTNMVKTQVKVEEIENGNSSRVVMELCGRYGCSEIKSLSDPVPIVADDCVVVQPPPVEETTTEAMPNKSLHNRMGDLPKNDGSGSRFNALVEEDAPGEESGATEVNGGELKYQLGSSKGVKFRNPMAVKNKQGKQAHYNNLKQAQTPKKATNTLKKRNEPNIVISSPTVLNATSSDPVSAKLMSHIMKEKEKEILHKMQVLHKQGINGLDHMVSRVQYRCTNTGSLLSNQSRQADGAGSSSSKANELPDKEEDEETGPAMEIDAIGAEINLQRKIENQSVTLGL
ncbi:hypothetical protein RIF29_35005 [Crotalaria pallida]|uniref:Uncharacterized protein n=1 Tax=Crotalaria pallida TaxID=3830 RepID=A0AAN9EF86_CROPI